MCEAHRGEHERRIRSAAGQVRRGGDLAAAPDDVHDHTLAATGHAFHHGIDDIDVGEVLGVHGRAPCLGRQIVGRGAAGRACAVHQDVDRPELSLHGVHHAGSRPLVDQVCRDGQGRSQDPACVRKIGLGARRDGEDSAFGEKALGTGEADALASARDQNDFVSKLEVHWRGVFTTKTQGARRRTKPFLFPCDLRGFVVCVARWEGSRKSASASPDWRKLSRMRGRVAVACALALLIASIASAQFRGRRGYGRSLQYATAAGLRRIVPVLPDRLSARRRTATGGTGASITRGPTRTCPSASPS